MPILFRINNALQRLVDRVPFSLWDQSDGDIKMSSRFQYNGAAARTPRHLLSNLCSRDTGHLFFPLLNKVLEHLPLLQFQSDIPDYLKMVMRSFVKQGPALEFSSALFFYFLVACSPNQENELFFRKMDFSVDEKQKKKKQSGVVIDNSIVGVLIDVFSAVMKTSRPANPQICELLMRSLIAIERRSSAEDWEPDVTMEGTTNFNGPLNRLACLVLDDAQNLFLVKVLEAVLAKASLESVHSISRETKEKLLAMPSFDQHQKLIAASREKKPVTKIVVTKAAPKPAAKKVVVSAPVLLSPAKKPVGKKMAHKPCAKLSVSQTNPDEPVVPISSQQLIAASISVHQQDLPKTLSTDSSSDDDGGYFPPENLNRPILRNSWADDSDFEEDDVGSKKSVRYRHEPYSLFFNRKVIVKSGHDVTVSDVLCVSNGNKKG